jgi:hypothetical protein
MNTSYIELKMEIENHQIFVDLQFDLKNVLVMASK